MVYSNAPTYYYSTLHDSITSLCKTILPFGFKKRYCLPSAEHRLSKLQSDNLKWQQDSFHQMLNLMGLHNEEILPETEVSAFRTHLLETLLASPPEQQQQHQHPLILRDKLLFLQELLYAKCISEEEYHSSKRPLLQRLAVQGAEIEARDVILAGSEEEWSVIDLKDEQGLINKENSNSKKKTKQAMKQNKGAGGAPSVFSFVSSYKPGKNSMEKSIFDSPSLHLDSTQSKIPSSFSTKNEMEHSKENPFWDGQAKGKESESGTGPDKSKRKPFRTLFHREKREGHGGGGGGLEAEEIAGKSAKKQWGFDGFKKWKTSDSDDETAPLPLNERSDSEAYSDSYQLFTRAFGEGQDTKLTKKKLHSDGSRSDFSIDKVSGDKIKKELSRIQTELNSTSPNHKFSNDQMEAISTKLPVDKAELKNYFPKSWCDRYGDVVLDVVNKEFEDHVGEMEHMRDNAEEKHGNEMPWTIFEDDENLHPNLFVRQDNSFHSSSINPFSQGFAENKWN